MKKNATRRPAKKSSILPTERIIEIHKEYKTRTKSRKTYVNINVKTNVNTLMQKSSEVYNKHKKAQKIGKLHANSLGVLNWLGSEISSILRSKVYVTITMATTKRIMVVYN